MEQRVLEVPEIDASALAMGDGLLVSEEGEGKLGCVFNARSIDARKIDVIDVLLITVGSGVTVIKRES